MSTGIPFNMWQRIINDTFKVEDYCFVFKSYMILWSEKAQEWKLSFKSGKNNKRKYLNQKKDIRDVMDIASDHYRAVS